MDTVGSPRVVVLHEDILVSVKDRVFPSGAVNFEPGPFLVPGWGSGAEDLYSLDFMGGVVFFVV